MKSRGPFSFASFSHRRAAAPSVWRTVRCHYVSRKYFLPVCGVLELKFLILISALSVFSLMRSIFLSHLRTLSLPVG